MPPGMAVGGRFVWLAGQWLLACHLPGAATQVDPCLLYEDALLFCETSRFICVFALYREELDLEDESWRPDRYLAARRDRHKA